MSLRFTLLADGSSDRALLPILEWILAERHGAALGAPGQQAELGRLPRPPKRLADRIRRSVELYPCDLLFVHRDAEREAPERRREEIEQAASRADLTGVTLLPVVPVRMQEAWLLIDEQAIRRAADNPNGTEQLELPPLDMLERLPDPKAWLNDLLIRASGFGRRRKRRRRRFVPGRRAYRVAEQISTFEPLLQLSAFQELDRRIGEALERLGR